MDDASFVGRHRFKHHRAAMLHGLCGHSPGHLAQLALAPGTVAFDINDHRGHYGTLVQHNCAGVYEPGDYDNDRMATMPDLLRLIDFIAQSGPPPEGGAMRADCNCDNVINVADIIYYMNYLYGTASPPCR